jgi:hypothetical protein
VDVGNEMKDIGLSGWWVIILWFSLAFDVKLLFIVANHFATEVNGAIFYLGMAIELVSIIYLIILFF